MAITYCNLTTDLADAYSSIEKYKNLQTLTGWELVTGSIYKLDQSGFVEMVFENGVEMTDGGDTTPAAGEFWYDSSTDILYVQLSDSSAPADNTLQSGPPWTVLKTRARNDAQEILEGLLSQRFAVPFQKVIAPAASYNSRSYDYAIRHATALLTCSLIVRRTNPDDTQADKLYFRVDNPRVQGIISDDPPGLAQRILTGDIALKTQLTAREVGGFNLYEASGNGATAFLVLSGDYTRSQREVWTIKIDTLGAPGTATYKISYDEGGTYDYTLKETRNGSSDNRRVSLGAGIYGEFVGTFAVDDEWTVELWPSTDKVTASGVGSVRLSR